MEATTDGIPVRLLVTAVMRIGRDWAARGVCSGFWRCYWNAEAGATVELAAGGSHAISPDAVHLVPAWVGFSCRCVRELPHWYAHVDVVGWPSSLVGAAFPRPVAVRDPVLVALASDTAQRLRAGLDGLAAQAAAKAVALAALSRAVAAVPPGQRAPLEAVYRSGPLAPVLEHIRQYLGQPLDNGALAAVAGCTSDHLIRLFRQHLGQTPGQYLQERRIAAAAELLFAAPERSIEQVAADCGFANRYHFSRVFTRHLGSPPGRFRRMERV